MVRSPPFGVGQDSHEMVGPSCCSTHAVKELHRNRRVRLRKQRHHSCAEGRRPKNRPFEEGDDSDLGLASRRGCVLTATACRPETVGWAPSVCAGPLTASLRGLGQWPPATGQWWNARRGPQNRPGDAGGWLRTPGLATQRESFLTATESRALKTAWVATVRKREWTKEPHCARSKGRCGANPILYFGSFLSGQTQN